MKYLIWSLIFLCNAGYSQRESIPRHWHDESPKFANQGEQEDYWSWLAFSREIIREKRETFPGLVHVEDNIIYFDKNSSIAISDTNSELFQIFTKGIFYPELLGMENISISAFIELKFLNISPNFRRFRFWLWYPNEMNPQVFLFELQNDKAIQNTTLSDFIEGSNVTFIKSGWIIL